MSAIPMEAKPEELRQQIAETPRDEKALATIQERRLAAFAPDVNEVMALAARLKMMLTYRGADKLSRDERIALASAALVYNLNPAVGELWFIPGYGLFLGAKGWMQMLDRESVEHRFTWWPQYEMLQHHEYPTYGVPDGAQAAWKCTLRRSDWNEAYLRQLEVIGKTGVQLPFEQLLLLLGTPPNVTGVGFIGPDEDFDVNASYKKDGEAKNQNRKGGMSIAERAQKRAFAQCCRQMIPLGFAPITEGDVIEGKVIDSEWKVTSPEGEEDPKLIGGSASEGDSKEEPPVPPQPEAQPESALVPEPPTPEQPAELELEVADPQPPPPSGNSGVSPLDYLRNLRTPQNWGAGTSLINKALKDAGSELHFSETELRIAISQRKGGEPKPANVAIKDYWLTGIVVAEEALKAGKKPEE